MTMDKLKEYFSYYANHMLYCRMKRNHANLDLCICGLNKIFDMYDMPHHGNTTYDIYGHDDVRDPIPEKPDHEFYSRKDVRHKNLAGRR